MTCWLCGFETAELATNAKSPACDSDHACQICAAVANVDEEIKQAVDALHRLLSKRSDLHSEQNRVHGAFIHRLPTEIMHYIFELLSPARTEWGGIWKESSRIQPPAIPSYTSICRNWRDLAWSNPSLWSTIQITLGRRVPTSDTSNPTNFLRDWIRRSQTLPLTFHIVEKGSSEPDLKGIIDAISQSSNRCRSLSLDIFSLALLQAFGQSNFPCHLLRNLRIHTTKWRRDINRHVLSNLTIRPEKIEIRDVPLQSLQIAWDYLTSATVAIFDLQDLAHLFRYASQMTWCYVQVSDAFHDNQVSIPPIVHHNLKTLIFNFGRDGRGAQEFLRYLTLPRLQQVHTSETFLLPYLPDLVDRSSCPLTRIILQLRSRPSEAEEGVFCGLHPLHGMTDLVIEHVEVMSHSATILRLLFEEYFPDLRILTLRLQAFYALWDHRVIPKFLDHTRPRLGVANKGRLRKIRVIERHPTPFDTMNWDSEVGEELEELELDIDLTEEGFEILIPED